MTYKLAWSTGFKRGFKKITRNNKPLQEKIFITLEYLCRDPFDASLKTHKLHGKLAGLWTCSVEYDCRLVFTFDKLHDSVEEEVIVLIDIGKHDEVY